MLSFQVMQAEVGSDDLAKLQETLQVPYGTFKPLIFSTREHQAAMLGAATSDLSPYVDEAAGPLARIRQSRTVTDAEVFYNSEEIIAVVGSRPAASEPPRKNIKIKTRVRIYRIGY